MVQEKIPVVVAYESGEMNLRQLYDRVLTKKPQLEERGYLCSWLFENIGIKEPLLLMGGRISTRDELFFYIDRDLFSVMISYNLSTRTARCSGSVKTREESGLCDLVKSSIAEFSEITGVDIHINPDDSVYD